MQKNDAQEGHWDPLAQFRIPSQGRRLSSSSEEQRDTLRVQLIISSHFSAEIILETNGEEAP